MSLNFSDFANKKLNEIEAVPLPPVGHYRFAITKIPEITTTNNGMWDILNVPCRAQEAVDVEDIADYKGDIKGILMSVRFMFDKNDEVAFTKTLNQVKRFFTKHVKCASDDDEIKIMLNNCVGQEFLGTVKWTVDKNDAEIMYANIATTAPLE